MKRLVWSTVGAAALGAALLWAVAEIAPSRPDLPSLMPDGALLYLQAKDFHALLKEWNDSAEKRIWLEGGNYQAFSRSRLFARLSQAQDEFSAAAGISTDNALLSSVAGKQSALALYDIGNLEFAYVTRMDQAEVEATPLWQVRGKFEQRSEGGAEFFVHKDAQSNRTAAFAARGGWLILATRENLVAGVLDRIQGVHAHSMPDEPWYADAVKSAAGPADDLRMVLNLEKIVPSPQFRSYWVQRNVTEMKQYYAALCDLHRGADAYREDRVLLRKPNLPPAASGDVQALAALAPDDAVFYSAQATGDTGRVLNELRENMLDLKPEQVRAAWQAPAAVAQENAGSASMLEERIDLAPVSAKEADPYQSLRAVLEAAQPSALAKVYRTRTSNGDMFVAMDRAIVIQAASAWNENAVQAALTAALRPGLTASQLGVGWAQSAGPAGRYFALDGQVQLYFAARDKLLLVSTDAALLEHLLARQQKTGQPQPRGVTYAAVFRHSPGEQQNFAKLAGKLDRAGRANSGESAEDAGNEPGRSPAFFSGNIASLSRMYSGMTRESIEETDQGAAVTQTVVYQWQRP